jgi:hypothetical protein
LLCNRNKLIIEIELTKELLLAGTSGNEVFWLRLAADEVHAANVHLLRDGVESSNDLYDAIGITKKLAGI